MGRASFDQLNGLTEASYEESAWPHVSLIRMFPKTSEACQHLPTGFLVFEGLHTFLRLREHTFLRHLVMDVHAHEPARRTSDVCSSATFLTDFPTPTNVQMPKPQLNLPELITTSPGLETARFRCCLRQLHQRHAAPLWQVHE